MKHIFTVHTGAALLVAALNLFSTAQAASEKFTKQFPLTTDGQVRIANVNGGIEIRSWDGEGVKLEATKEGRNADIVAGIRIITESTPSRLTVRTELPKIKRGWLRGTSQEGQVSYVLLVPAEARLEKVETVNGNVDISGVRGSVRASTVNGSIKCRALEGATELETVNGNIRTEHAALKANGGLKASSVNGGIEVQLPADASTQLSGATVNGSIDSDFEFTTATKQSRRSIEARIGGGDSKVDLNTVNGSIRVRKSGNEHATTR